MIKRCVCSIFSTKSKGHSISAQSVPPMRGRSSQVKKIGYFWRCLQSYVHFSLRTFVQFCAKPVIVLQKAKNVRAGSITNWFLGFLNGECFLLLKSFSCQRAYMDRTKICFQQVKAHSMPAKNMFLPEKKPISYIAGLDGTRSASITLLILLYFIIAHRVVSSFMITN